MNRIIIRKASRHGKGRFLAGILLVFFMGLSSTGTEAASRVQALGGNGAYFEDQTNVLRWYGSLTDYPDRAVVEAGKFNLPWGYHNEAGELFSGPGTGIHLALGDEGGLGTCAVYFHGRDADADPGSLARGNLKNTTTILYSRPVGAVEATLMIRRGSESASETAQGILLNDLVAHRSDRSRLDIGGGLRLDLSTDAYIDLAGEFRHTKFEETWTTLGDETSVDDRISGGNFNLRSRAFYRLGPRTALVPVAEILLANEPLPASMTGWIPYQDGHIVRAGCGLNHFPDTDKFLLASLEYRSGQNETTTWVNNSPGFTWFRDWSSLSLVLGAESRFLSWLSLRGACSYEHLSVVEGWRNNTVVSGALHDVDQESDTLSANLGAALHLGPYDLDLAMSENFPSTPANYMGHHGFRDDNNWLSCSLRRSF